MKIIKFNKEATEKLLKARTLEETKEALAAGADVNAKDSKGRTALMLAKTTEQRKLLIDAGAEADFPVE